MAYVDKAEYDSFSIDDFFSTILKSIVHIEFNNLMKLDIFQCPISALNH